MYLSATPAPADSTPSWVTQVLALSQGALALKQQRDIQSINTDRLRQGLPPIDASDVAVGAKVAMDPGQLNKILIASGIGLSLILAVLVISRRRR
jgi:hypothetical protein